MPLTDRTRPAPAYWPGVGQLERLASGGALVLLPDRIDEIDGEVRASYRDEAQGLRVRARQRGLDVVLAVPPHSRPALLREHDATLVLGAILSIPSGVGAALIANEIQRRLDNWREDREASTEEHDRVISSFTVRAREVVIEDGEARLREIEGPAEEVIKVLQAQARADNKDPVRARPEREDVP